jgi:hypothetical protein
LSYEEEINNKIDDYLQTIHAIVGFMNFYRYDNERREIRSDVIVFQGRRFNPSPAKSFSQKGDKVDYVTPDIGILLPTMNGVIGEVKKSFPAKQKYWLKTFKQLMKYDDDLTGWPTDDERVNDHDIVLILHQSRAVQVAEFYETNKGTEIEIVRPFSIVEFNRSDERMPYYFFRRALGNLSEKTINKQLKYGVQIPMEKLHVVYSIIKLYDDEPPLPYLLQVIWTNVVLERARESERFVKLRKNQKMEVNLEVETIIEELHKGFSFRALCDKDSERQPRIPKREWVLRACNKLVELKEAKWIDQQKTTLTVFFKEYDDIKTHFIKCCADEPQEDIQPKLFDDEEFE